MSFNRIFVKSAQKNQLLSSKFVENSAKNILFAILFSKVLNNKWTEITRKTTTTEMKQQQYKQQQKRQQQGHNLKFLENPSANGWQWDNSLATIWQYCAHNLQIICQQFADNLTKMLD